MRKLLARGQQRSGAAPALAAAHRRPPTGGPHLKPEPAGAHLVLIRQQGGAVGLLHHIKGYSRLRKRLQVEGNAGEELRQQRRVGRAAAAAVAGGSGGGRGTALFATVPAPCQAGQRSGGGQVAAARAATACPGGDKAGASKRCQHPRRDA